MNILAALSAACGAILIAGSNFAIAQKPEEGLIGERGWTNAKGQTMTAAVVSLSGDTATFKMPDGRTLPYDIGNLIEADRMVIRDAAEAAKVPKQDVSRPEVSDSVAAAMAKMAAAKAEAEGAEEVREGMEDFEKAWQAALAKPDERAEAAEKEAAKELGESEKKMVIKKAEEGVDMLFGALEERYEKLAPEAPETFWQEFRRKHEEEVRQQLVGDMLDLAAKYPSFKGSAKEVARVHATVRDAARQNLERAMTKVEAAVKALVEGDYLDPVERAVLEAHLRDLESESQ